MKKKLKVQVVDGLTQETIDLIIKNIKEKIKAFIDRNQESPLYISPESMRTSLRITERFFEFRHVCMKCGDVQDMATYAIAQNAMGHKVNYTCDCGHVTILPQFKIHYPK